MRAYDIALEMYDGKVSELFGIIAMCAKVGFVYADADIFVCAYPTNSGLVMGKSDAEEITLDKADTWYVYVAVGSLEKICECFRPLEYVAYERFDGQVRLIESERFLSWAEKRRHQSRPHHQNRRLP
jgi:hypothetical protein